VEVWNGKFRRSWEIIISVYQFFLDSQFSQGTALDPLVSYSTPEVHPAQVKTLQWIITQINWGLCVIYYTLIYCLNRGRKGLLALRAVSPMYIKNI
jgi:hypothetical protein